MAGRTRRGSIYRRGGVWWLKYQVAGRMVYQSLGPGSRQEAEAKRAEIMRPLAQAAEADALAVLVGRMRRAKDAAKEAQRPPLMVAEAWAAFVKSPSRPDSGPATLRAYECHFDVFEAWIGATYPAAKALRDVTPEMARAYAEHLSGARKLSANTYNKHIRFLDLLWRVLREPGQLASNPWEAIQRKRQRPHSRRELTIAELNAVCAAAAGEMRLLFALGSYTGLRLGDCATLRWAEVDLHRRLIRRVPSKIARRNAAPVVIPIHETLLDMLHETPSARGEFVLPETASQYQADATALVKRIQTHFNENGVRTSRPAGPGKRAVVEVGFHSLRHTFVSMCREAGAPLAVVEAIVGHSNPAMTRHYSHVSELAAGHAVAALPAGLGEVGGPVSRKQLPARSASATLRGIVTELEGATGKTWAKVRAAAVAELGALVKELERGGH